MVSRTMAAELRAPGRMSLAVATFGVLAVAAWALTAEHADTQPPEHHSPATVEPIGDGQIAWVSVTPEAARRIGLDVTPVGGSEGAVQVPYSALIHDADGEMWVYVADPEDQLRFSRLEVEVTAVTADVVTLRDGPPPGTMVAGDGAAELYGTEFEVGH